ncbi:DUF2207 domain-containing protein [Luteimonas marina]|uniref:DUF2207 domain-containing protein n=1 Tax=Luteimonas marina TaxID=488485 RepID=A0A5C5TVQ9_9GAMM|nr:DUF2207 domain-containing protein [Luteimonas marina]TWT17844.1 DUF2207 domain-containing protein [Luteimonas marina]
MSAPVRLFAIALALLLAAATLPLAAQERIESYDSEITLNADGSLDVVEHIRVRAEGHQIRRGIQRDFPTRYRDRYGNRMVVDFDVIEVRRDGRPEPWFTETRSNGVRVNTGNDDFLPTPGSFTFSIHYRTTRQLGFFADHDELYWNAIGTGSVFPIEQGGAEVQLPQAVPAAEMDAEGYTGAQGQRGQSYDVTLPSPGVARWRLTAPLAPGEGLTLVLSFPKGLVPEPTAAQKFLWLLKDNRAVLVALLGLIVVLAYCVLRWRQVGRDPPPGTVIARYEPPAGISPAGLRFIRRMGYDTRCFSADVLSLAVARCLLIERDKGLMTDHWRLERTDGGDTNGTPGEQTTLLGKLFAGRAALELDKDNADTVQAAIRAHWKALDRRFKGTMFNNNGGSTALAFLLALLFSGIAIAVGVGTGSGLLFALVPIALMVLAAIVFAFLVRAPTREGRKMLDHIEGLRRYLGVAEKQDLQRLQGPEGAEPTLDAKRFEFLLPYAVALDVEDAWTKKFTLAVGAAAAAAATSAMAWYHGTGSVGDIGGFTTAIGNSLASQIASSSSPPGSSSGGGGGGFSGGGGGGGGVGGR